MESQGRSGFDENSGKKIAVFYASDGSDYDRLEASAWSVRKFFGDTAKIFILTERYWGPAIYGATLINPCDVLRDAGFFPYGWARQDRFSSLYKLAIPLLKETQSIDRALYLETDALVISNMALDLVNDAMHACIDAEVMAAPDTNFPKNRNKQLISNDMGLRASIRLSDLWARRDTVNAVYVNSGVIVLNLRRIRENGLSWYKERLGLLWEGQLRGKFSFPAQDFVNSMMEVDPRLDVKLNSVRRQVTFNYAVLRHKGDRKMYMLEDAASLGYFKNAAASAEMPDNLDEEHAITGSQQVALFICYRVNKESIYRYRKLRDDVHSLGIRVIWCCNCKGDRLPELPYDVDVIFMSDDEIRKDKSLTFDVDGRPVLHSSNTVFMMHVFKVLGDEVQYVWCIEYDVCYSGDWSTFFNKTSILPHDFLGERFASRYQESDWCWWGSSPLNGIHCKYQYKCLNCISRISRRMYRWLTDFYSGCRLVNRHGAFYENAWPTVAMLHGSAYDLYSRFCSREFSFSVSSTKTIIPDKLYHAIKLDVSWQDIVDYKLKETKQ